MTRIFPSQRKTPEALPETGGTLLPGQDASEQRSPEMKLLPSKYPQGMEIYLLTVNRPEEHVDNARLLYLCTYTCTSTCGEV